MVRPYLLDVNVLLALGWPSHVHHHDARKWFERKAAKGFATCPLTQLGFVRLSSNPRFSREAVTPSTALLLLDKITSLKGHVFWTDSLSCGRAFRDSPLISGNRQITDLYLVSLAQANEGILATLDRAVPSGSYVEILS